LLYPLTFTDAHSSRSQNVERTAKPGQLVLLPCSLPNATTKNWRYHHDGNIHSGRAITHHGVVTSEFRERFQLNAEGLLIQNVKREDQGKYTCIDQLHRRHRRNIHLSVSCESNVYCFAVLAVSESFEEVSYLYSMYTLLPLFTACRNARIASVVLATAIPSVCPSVRLFVCLSVTRRYCVKTTARSTVQFTLSDSKMCLVLWKPKIFPRDDPFPLKSWLNVA